MRAYLTSSKAFWQASLQMDGIFFLVRLVSAATTRERALMNFLKYLKVGC